VSKSRAEQTCEKIIDQLLNEDGIRANLQYSRAEIIKAIMYERGIDPRTLERWLNALRTFRYIEPSAVNLYRINLSKIPKIIKMLKEEPQTKI